MTKNRNPDIVNEIYSLVPFSYKKTNNKYLTNNK